MSKIELIEENEELRCILGEIREKIDEALGDEDDDQTEEEE